MQLEKMKLGKQRPRYDSRTLMLSKYTKAMAPAPRQAGYVSEVVSWPMMLNNTLGDCTIACAGHMIEQWTTYAGDPFTPTDAELETAYEAVSGYVPGEPSTDNGAVVLDVLNYWRKTGIGGHKIGAYVAVNYKDHEQVKLAVQLFGNCYIGIGLPVSAQSPGVGYQGLPFWNVPPEGVTGNGTPYSWGGHAIPIVEYGVALAPWLQTEIVTWGELYAMSWGFIDAYVDEAYAVLSTDWIAANQQSPSGFDLAQLQADLAAITGA